MSVLIGWFIVIIMSSGLIALFVRELGWKETAMGFGFCAVVILAILLFVGGVTLITTGTF